MLRIETEVPSAFQQKLLPDYINLTEHQELVLDVQMGGNPDTGRDEVKQPTTPVVKNYEFATDDYKWKINLTRNFLSLSTNNYHSWEECKAKFAAALNAFVGVYNPIVFTRIGLRYVDLIIRSKLNLNDTDWTELIGQQLLGVLASEDIKKSIKTYQSTFVLELGKGEGVVRVATGIVKLTETGENCFLIDSDYSDARKKKAEEIIPKLDYFHSKAFGLFQWCITEKLHTSMGPQNVE
jgi:uncharacterized protein (TIGR04255 family)